MNDFSNGDSVFFPSHSLMGHEDWVRSLDFISEGNTVYHQFTKLVKHLLDV